MNHGIFLSAKLDNICFNFIYDYRNGTIKLLFFQSGTATGTCGTISWQIEHLDTRLIVMWSVPFNFNIHDSYFAVGMIFNRGRFTSSSYWFNQMYYSEKGANFLGIFVWENNVLCLYCYCIMYNWEMYECLNDCSYCTYEIRFESLSEYA